MRYLISFVCLLVFSASCLAQPYGDSKFKAKFNKADALTYDGSYLEALPLLEDMYAYDTTNANLNYLLGVCYLMGKKDHTLAIRRLESATKDVSLEHQEANWKERKAPGLAYYYLGRAYHFKNRFDRAVTNYYNYRSFIEMDDVATYNQVRLQIQYAENAMELIKTPVGVKATNLGPQINTKYPDYCPVVSADGRVLIFTSRRAGGTSEAVDQDGSYYDDIYVCQKQPNGKWSAPKSIGANINTTGHEAAIGLSPDGQLLFIYKDDNGDGNIYESQRNADGWTKAELLGSDINTSSWETHATVNATQDMLIFVSNRSEGGYGGRDLWYCKELPTGEWGLAINMGSVINTQYEEDSPFISPDGGTLIFSSQGHTSMGGFDIFKSEFVDGAWTNPENIGYPINTAEDDVFFTLTPDGRHAYYSSRMDGGYGDNDLYKLRLDPKQSDAVAVARGVMKVPAQDYANIKAKIVVSDEGGAQIGTYRPNPATGFYVVILKPGETYSLSYEADGYDPIIAQVPIGDEEVYAENDGVVELEEVVFGENILAMQAETERLRKEKEAAEAKAAEEARLAADTDAQAKRDAEQLALTKEQDAERLLAEARADQEREAAAKELAAQQEKTKQAEIDRKKKEAKAKYEAELAAKAAEEAAVKKKSDEELAAKLAEEAAELAKSQKEQEAKIAEEAAAREEAGKAQLAQIAKEAEEREVAAKLEKETVALAASQAEAEQKLASEREAQELVEKKSAEQEQIKQAEAEAKAEAERAHELAAFKLAEEEARKVEMAAAEEAAKQADEAELATAKTIEKEKANEELARKVADAVAREKATEELAAKQKEEEDAAAQAVLEEASRAAQEDEAQRLALAEDKRKALQERIDALKNQQETQPVVQEQEVKEVAVQNIKSDESIITVDAEAVKAKREAMLARIEQLKKRKDEVEKKKVEDEAEVVKASEKEKEALRRKQELEAKSGKTKEEIAELQKELAQVEGQVKKVDEEIEVAKTEVAIAEEKVAQDIAEAKNIAEEAKKKEEEAAEAKRQIEEIEKLERQRIEQERLAAEQFEKEQREEAERARLELIQIEALAEQKKQVDVALAAEERKRKQIEAAEKDAYSQEEILANSATLEQLRDLSRQLIKDNLDLKRQLAEVNAKLDMILERLDYAPEAGKVDLPGSNTMKNLEEGKRLILRNIFFDYNQATLRSRSKHELNKLYSFMKERTNVSIQVSGHTDSRGNDDYNMRLSKDRAQAVVDYLVRNGISSSRLTAVGYGETRPIARNENDDLSDNPIGRQLNRRIEISLPKGAADEVEVETIQVPTGARID